MTSKLVIQLNNSIEKWALLDDQGGMTLEPSQESILDFLSRTKNCDLFVLVPAKDVLLTEVKLPKLSKRKLMKALPFALQDKLVDEMENIHFAVGDRQKNAGFPIAVVSKAKMALWLFHLSLFLKDKSQFNIVMLSQVLALPLNLKGWTVYIDGTQALVRLGPDSGFEIETQYLWLLLRLVLKNQADLKPEAIQVCGQLPLSKAESDFWTGEKITVDYLEPKVSWAFMAEALDGRHTLNLLQGPYKTNFIPPLSSKRVFRGLALLGMWLAILTAGNFTKLYILEARQQQLLQAIQAGYEKTSPTAPFIYSDIEKVLKRQLRKLRDKSRGNEFLGLIADLSPIVSGLPGIKLLGLTFENKVLTLDLEAAAFSDVDKFIKALQLKDFKIEHQTELKTDKLIKVQLTIKELGE